jgi:hypothetical protein
MIEPKEVQIVTMAGETKTYILSKFSAIAGREIVAKYPLSSLPKLGEYAINEEVMLKLMAFVAVPLSGGEQKLTTRALVDNHVPDWETLAKLEIAMLEYNTSFFLKGGILKVFDGLETKLRALITQTLTGLSAQSSQAARPRSKS